MTPHTVDISNVEKDNYKIRPSRWIFSIVLLVLLMIYIFVISQSFDVVELKWLVIVVGIIVFTGLTKSVTGGNYMVTLVADSKGLYFQKRPPREYYFIPWAEVLIIEKTSFPLNTRGLRVGIDCKYREDAEKNIGNTVDEDGLCYIQTIPQLLNRDKVIKKLMEMRSLHVHNL